MFYTYFNDLKLLKSMHGCTGVAEFIDLVLDDTRSHLRSYLYEYPVLGNVLYDHHVCAVQIRGHTLADQSKLGETNHQGYLRNP